MFATSWWPIPTATAFSTANTSAADARSTANTVLYWNEEFRATLWGHMTLVNLKQVVAPFHRLCGLDQSFDLRQ